jgi:hypothetical protein
MKTNKAKLWRILLTVITVSVLAMSLAACNLFGGGNGGKTANYKVMVLVENGETWEYDEYSDAGYTAGGKVFSGPVGDIAAITDYNLTDGAHAATPEVAAFIASIAAALGNSYELIPNAPGMHYTGGIAEDNSLVLTAEFRLKGYAITKQVKSGGSASINLTSAPAGKTVEVTVMPNSGNMVNNVRVICNPGTADEFDDGAYGMDFETGKFIFGMPESPIKIVVSFRPVGTPSLDFGEEPITAQFIHSGSGEWTDYEPGMNNVALIAGAQVKLTVTASQQPISVTVMRDNSQYPGTAQPPVNGDSPQYPLEAESILVFYANFIAGESGNGVYVYTFNMPAYAVNFFISYTN